MKVYDCRQGSEEWLRVRAGIPTASQFDKIVTPTGRRSTQQELYMYTLLAERLLGRPVLKHISQWMERGSEMEQHAVSYYEFERDVDTEPVGFIVTDDGRVGASPDRLIADDGCLEIKAPSEGVQMMYLFESGGAYNEYKVQIQGQLWVTDRSWTDVLAWHPELPPALIRIERDTDFIMKMRPLIMAFSEELEKLAVMLDEIEVPSAKSFHELKLTEMLKQSLIQLKDK
jgi:hypothetical protein